MSRFKAWWNNENYDRGHMRRFRSEHPEWSDLPDEAVATSFAFAVSSLHQSVAELWVTIKKEFFDV